MESWGIGGVLALFVFRLLSFAAIPPSRCVRKPQIHRHFPGATLTFHPATRTTQASYENRHARRCFQLDKPTGADCTSRENSGWARQEHPGTLKSAARIHHVAQ